MFLGFETGFAICANRRCVASIELGLQGLPATAVGAKARGRG